MTRRLKDDITDSLEQYFDIVNIVDESDYDITFEIFDAFIDDSILYDKVEGKKGEIEFFDFWEKWNNKYMKAIITVVNPYNEFN